MKIKIILTVFFTGIVFSFYAQESKKPNVIYIMTDQMSADMLSCTGNPYVNTPNLDSLAATGIRFERAYASNPVCVPSRYSMFTGTMPSRIGLEHNSQQRKIDVPQMAIKNSMGHLFSKAGYETVYGGKTHLMGQNGIIDDGKMWGFDILTDDFYEQLAVKSVDYILSEHDKPFLLVASFMNPHDICYVAINEYEQSQGRNSKGDRFLTEALERPKGVTEEEFIEHFCPPLPSNFEIPKNELTAFMADKPEFMHYARDSWDEKDWRIHRWAYARLTEMVDAKIGRLLNAIKDAGLEDNTIIIYSSDHGDQDSSHRVEHKAFLYEESARVPFLVSWKGKIESNLVDNKHLVSAGLDLLPTICDLAGVEIPAHISGRSIKPLLTSNNDVKWRDNLVVENHDSRLLINDNWKYMVGKKLELGDFKVNPRSQKVENQVREMLVNLKTDPGEMINLAPLHYFQDQLLKGRTLLKKWYSENNESIDQKYIIGGKEN